MTWAPKNKGGEERRAGSGAEESQGCLNGDTKGTNTVHCPPSCGAGVTEGTPGLPLARAPPAHLRACACSVPSAPNSLQKQLLLDFQVPPPHPEKPSLAPYTRVDFQSFSAVSPFYLLCYTDLRDPFQNCRSF